MLDIIIHCSKIFHLVQRFNRTETDISPFVEFYSYMRICFFFSNPVQQQNIKMNKNKKYSVSKRLTSFCSLVECLKHTMGFEAST